MTIFKLYIKPRNYCYGQYDSTQNNIEIVRACYIGPVTHFVRTTRFGNDRPQKHAAADDDDGDDDGPKLRRDGLSPTLQRYNTAHTKSNASPFPSHHGVQSQPFRTS